MMVVMAGTSQVKPGHDDLSCGAGPKHGLAFGTPIR